MRRLNMLCCCVISKRIKHEVTLERAVCRFVKYRVDLLIS